MDQEAMNEEVMMEMTQEEVREEGAGVVGSAESDELEAKTQENPTPPEEATGEDEGSTGDEPTMRDKIREMEWRHATGVEDLETGPDEERFVRDGEGGVIRDGDEELVLDKGASRRTAEEVSSSESDDCDVEEMSTEDEEELWRRVGRDGFPREDTEVAERPDGFPREEDIDTTPGVWFTPPQPR